MWATCFLGRGPGPQARSEATEVSRTLTSCAQGLGTCSDGTAAFCASHDSSEMGQPVSSSFLCPLDERHTPREGCVLRFYNKVSNKVGVSEMAQQVKVLAAKPGDMSSIPGAHTV